MFLFAWLDYRERTNIRKLDGCRWQQLAWLIIQNLRNYRLSIHGTSNFNFIIILTATQSEVLLNYIHITPFDLYFSIYLLMFHLSLACPHHHLPYEFVVPAPNNSQFLKCRNCAFHPGSCRISTDLEHMSARMGSAKSTERSKSKGKTNSKGSHNSYEFQDEAIIVQMIAQDQVRTIELAMKLLTEDKKKCSEDLERKLGGHRKLWQELQESAKNSAFLNNLCQNQLLLAYAGVIAEQGWKNLDKALKKANDRTYVCHKIMKQSKEIIEEVKKSASSEQTILRNLQVLVERPNFSMLGSVGSNKCRDHTHLKRSKSFGSW